MRLDLNQRRVLNEFRLHGQASKADIVRSVGLTHPSATRIVQKLCELGYLEEKAEKRKGPRGQPATIYSLSEQNIFIGVHVGRQRLEFVALALTGTVLSSVRMDFGLLNMQKLAASGKRELERFLACGPQKDRRVAGIGISTPFFWEGWQSILPPEGADGQLWTSDMVASIFGFPEGLDVIVENDGSSAALGELTFGTGKDRKDFVYVNIGTLIGGGLVIDGTLRTGAHGNTAAIGPFPVAPSTLSAAANPPRPFGHLLERASLNALLKHAKSLGAVIDLSRPETLEEPGQGRVLDEWIADCSKALVQFFIGVWALIDIEAIILDSALPRWVLQRIIDETQAQIGDLRIEGIVTCEIKLGELGSKAQSVGAACLPILETLGPPR